MRGILTVVMLSQQMGLRNQWVNVKVLEKVLPFILHGLPSPNFEVKFPQLSVNRQNTDPL
jgi:hypothetical protein